MVLTHTWLQSISVALLGMLFLIGWAHVFKLTGRWRFELFYLDFSVGFALAALVLAFTLGNLGFDGFTVLDDLQHAQSRNLLFAVAAGICLNLGTLLVMASLSISGISVAFPVAAGTALVVTAAAAVYARGGREMLTLTGGAVLAVISVAVMFSSYSALVKIARKHIPKDARGRPAYRLSPIKAIVLAACGGIFLGGHIAGLTVARRPEIGLGPYGVVLLEAVMVGLSTIIFSLITMNLPLEGEPVDPVDFFKSGIRKHGLGLLAGILWCAGNACLLIASEQSGEGPINRPQFETLYWAAPLACGLLGMLLWKELDGGPSKVKGLAVLSILLAAAALLLIAFGGAFVRA
jgi:glucose uptake protein